MTIDNNIWVNVVTLVKTITILCRCEPRVNKVIHKAFNPFHIYACCKPQKIGER
jgi:hypothetical protein